MDTRFRCNTQGQHLHFNLTKIIPKNVDNTLCCNAQGQRTHFVCTNNPKNSGHFIPAATHKGSACTSLRQKYQYDQWSSKLRFRIRISSFAISENSQHFKLSGSGTTGDDITEHLHRENISADDGKNATNHWCLFNFYCL